ncbi:MAG: substrate-binding domain-containing protein [Janthinobacterium lividum]
MPVTTVKEEHQAFISQPAYQRLEEHLRANIASGLWPVGVMLPSRRDLAKSLGIDLRTLQRAIQPLLDDGTLKASGTRGTFVAKESLTEPLAGTAVPGANFSIAFREATKTLTKPLVIGMIDCDFLNAHNNFVLPMSWNALIAQGVETKLSEYEVVCRAYDRFDVADTGPISLSIAISKMIDEGVDGIVVCAMHNNREHPVEDVFTSVDLQKTPTVFISWQSVPFPVPQVYYDSQAAGYKAAEHLITAGYRPITYVGSIRDRWSKLRLAGVKEAVRQSSLPETDLLTAASANRLQERLENYAAERGMALDAFCPGIVGANDEYAYEALEVLRRAGLEPGTGFGAVGFDNSMGARRNGLTSLDPPMELLGKEAAGLVIKLIAGEKTPTQIKAFSRLVVRDSTRLRRGDST